MSRRHSVSGHRYTTDSADVAGDWVIRRSVCECDHLIITRAPTLSEAMAAAVRAGRDHRACAVLARGGEAA